MFFNAGFLLRMTYIVYIILGRVVNNVGGSVITTSSSDSLMYIYDIMPKYCM